MLSRDGDFIFPMESDGPYMRPHRLEKVGLSCSYLHYDAKTYHRDKLGLPSIV